MTTIDLNLQARAVPDVVTNQVAGETVLLNLNTASYFSLNEIGTRMWDLATTSATLEDAYQVLLDEYDVEPDVLHADFIQIIQQCLEHQLIELHQPE